MGGCELLWDGDADSVNTNERVWDTCTENVLVALTSCDVDVEYRGLQEMEGGAVPEAYESVTENDRVPLEIVRGRDDEVLGVGVGGGVMVTDNVLFVVAVTLMEALSVSWPVADCVYDADGVLHTQKVCVGVDVAVAVTDRVNEAVGVGVGGGVTVDVVDTVSLVDRVHGSVMVDTLVSVTDAAGEKEMDWGGVSDRDGSVEFVGE